jgi:hypothetical protein
MTATAEPSSTASTVDDGDRGAVVDVDVGLGGDLTTMTNVVAGTLDADVSGSAAAAGASALAVCRSESPPPQAATSTEPATARPTRQPDPSARRNRSIPAITVYLSVAHPRT